MNAKFGDYVKQFDSFSNTVQLKGPNRSYVGTFLTLIVFVLTLTYAIKRYSIMVEYGDT